MKSFSLSASNGYCRRANAKNLTLAKKEADQLCECIHRPITLLDENLKKVYSVDSQTLANRKIPK